MCTKVYLKKVYTYISVKFYFFQVVRANVYNK